MNITLDTNCLVQILPRKSKYRFLWDAYLQGEYVLCVSNDVLLEYSEILCRLAGQRIASLAIDTIVNNPATRFVNPYYRFGMITRDRDDNKFVDCAIVGNADYIVTEDRHFDELKGVHFPHVEVLGLDEFTDFFLGQK